MPEGICCACGMCSSAEHTDLRKVLGPNAWSVPPRTARNGRFQDTPQVNVALPSRKALNGNVSQRFGAFSCGAVQRRYYLENADSWTDPPSFADYGRTPETSFHRFRIKRTGAFQRPDPSRSWKPPGWLFYGMATLRVRFCFGC